MSKTAKHVLQQSNCNLDLPKEEDHKAVFVMRSKEEMDFETENHCSPEKKPTKSDAKKLRSIRLDLSSLKRGVIQKPSLNVSSDESSDDEVKKKRKPRPVVPNYVTNTENGPCRKPRQSRQDPITLSSQSHLAKSQPLSIARRNARERNRVKQVNEGFATLRSRIPEYISEAYNEEKGRKSAKKLSKVETLRMAVDYIRHLETLLDLRSTESDAWMKTIKTESQPWDTPTSSGEYPSPKYQPPCVDSPGTSYDQTFDYQDRIFYDYDLDFKGGDKNPATTFSVLTMAGNENENQCVDDFKYYETFNRIKKENGENINEEDVAEEEEEDNDEEDDDRDTELLPKPRDVIKKATKKGTVLPPITESFSKGIPVFF